MPLSSRLLRHALGILAMVPLAASVLPAAATADTAPPLGAYNADIAESSISGISSGAFMAVQFGTAWSSTIRGVGVGAGGPYYCAEGTASGALTGGVKPPPAAVSPADRTPTGFAAIDSSDTAIALASAPIAGASEYKVYRAADPAQPFALRGAVAGPSFGDAGLAPATRYRYRVTAMVDGAESPASAVITPATRPVPPRCATPGTCPIEGR